ncbi:hypothetical protein GUJ93_ZPchr0001g30840 [Zizania palustris]|uniref:TF-B3 domain-containing protein n=1 Tax=Zizania palustris TaxID=103762 RepID=A0A8J5VNP4_ZIZPA|nr:hypothetical protein GUJ93_ZPchr0001g30840 [Zizania palustris]
MDAPGGSSALQSHGDPARQGGGRGKAPATDARGEAADDFLFADDTFPSLPDFPCLSSPSNSTFSSSSSSSNSSSAFTTAAGGGAGGAAGEITEPATAADGFNELTDIDQLLDFASLSVPWDAEPLFPDDVGMVIEDAISGQPHPVCDGGKRTGDVKPVLEAAGAEDAGGDACMTEAADDLPGFFMEWLTSNREHISAEDLRSIRLRRSTIEAAAARLGGGRQGTMQLLKLILAWVKNHHLQKKRARTEAVASDPHGHGHGHGQLSSPGDNPGYEFPSGDQEMGVPATSWIPYQAFTPPSAYGPYPFQQSCSTSSVVVNSQPFSPPTAAAGTADMHASSGVNMSWPQQYAPFPGACTGPYPMPHPFAAGYAGHYSGGHAMSSQLLTVAEPSATKEARKKRMARQRRLSCLQQQRSQQLNLNQIQISGHPQEHPPRAAHSAPVTPSSGGCLSWGLWPPTGQQIIQNPPSNKPNPSTSKQQKPSPEPAAKPPYGARQEDSLQSSTASDKRQVSAKTDKNLRFLLQKVLKQSDVGSLGRIVLPKKEAEVHLPELKTRDGISIPMEDIGTARVWNMRYRFWPNNKSRMYLLENTGESQRDEVKLASFTVKGFVRSNELQEGDFIVIYSDIKSGKYLIRGVKVRRAQEQGGHNSSGAVGKHKNSGAGADADGGGGGGVDAAAAGKPDGAGCKGKSPHSVRRARHQEAASMNQMALSI